MTTDPAQRAKAAVAWLKDNYRTVPLFADFANFAAVDQAIRDNINALRNALSTYFGKTGGTMNGVFGSELAAQQFVILALKNAAKDAALNSVTQQVGTLSLSSSSSRVQQQQQSQPLPSINRNAQWQPQASTQQQQSQSYLGRIGGMFSSSSSPASQQQPQQQVAVAQGLGGRHVTIMQDNTAKIASQRDRARISHPRQSAGTRGFGGRGGELQRQPLPPPFSYADTVTAVSFDKKRVERYCKLISERNRDWEQQQAGSENMRRASDAMGYDVGKILSDTQNGTNVTPDSFNQAIAYLSNMQEMGMNPANREDELLSMSANILWYDLLENMVTLGCADLNVTPVNAQ